MAGLLTSLGQLIGIGLDKANPAGEGNYHEGPYYLPDSGGWLPEGTPLNFWQMGGDVRRGSNSSAIVQACVSAYAQTAAMCPGSHWRVKPDGGRERVTNSPLSRVLRNPNAYQTPSDFILNLTSRLYRTGNAYALIIRNRGGVIEELHIMNKGYPHVAQTGDVFYTVSGNEVIDRQFDSNDPENPLRMVPSRDIMHVRLETPRHPLVGETPLTAAALDLAVSNAMARQAIAFFDKQARPSGVLSTELNLTADQVKTLRERWEAQATKLNAGGTPILTNGLKFQPITTAAKDAQFAELMNMTKEQVALAFRVPLAVLGIGSTAYSSTESLMQAWIASGLGFCLNHIEQAFDQTFRLKMSPDEGSAYGKEYTEFDTAALLRSNFKDRMDGYAKAIVGGVLSPNEVAAEEGLPSRGPAGEMPRVQQQVVPLDYEPPAPAAPAPPAPDNGDGGDTPTPADGERAIEAFMKEWADAPAV
jgi:HK97 family phage portal protein